MILTTSVNMHIEGVKIQIKACFSKTLQLIIRVFTYNNIIFYMIQVLFLAEALKDQLWFHLPVAGAILICIYSR